MIAAITTWARRDARRHWRGLLALTLTIALGLAFAMVAAMGSRRTDSAWARFERHTAAPDVIGDAPIDELRSGVTGLAAEPGVTEVTAFSYMTVSYDGYQPALGWRTLGGFVGLTPSFGRTLYRPLIVDGRAPDPDRADEVTINEAGAQLTGLRPGDEIVMTSEPAVVRQPVTVVGIHRGSFDVGLNTDQPGFLLTPAFGDRWFGPYLDVLAPNLRRGFSGAVMAKVPDAQAREAVLARGYGRGDLLGAEIIGGLDAQSTAFAVLAAVAAFAVIAAAGQTVSRRVRRGATELSTLAALGLTPAGRRGALAAGPALAAVAGSLLAPFVAVAASPFVTTGLQRRVDLHRDAVVDLPVLVIGALGAAVMFTAIALLAATRADSKAAARPVQPHPLPVTLPGPAGLFGGRVAAGWANPSGRTVARAHALGVTVALTLTIGASAWSASADHVTGTPSSFGQSWDALITLPDDDETGDPTPVDTAQGQLAATPAIGTVLGRLVAGMVSTDKSGGVETLVVDQSAGSWWPTIVRGRVPAAGDEITVGRFVLTRLHKRLGDNVEIGGHVFTIVGEHVVPQFSNGDFGSTLAMSSAGTQLDVKLARPFLLVDLPESVTAARLQEVVAAGVTVLPSVSPTGRPGPIANLDRIGAIDEQLIAVCALMVAASLLNGLLLATRARRRDFATLRALGAGRATVTGAIAWHGAVVTGVALLLAVPLGLIVGQAAWHVTAGGLPVAPDLSHPWLVVGMVAGLTLVAGLATVLLTSWSNARPRASVLTPE